MAERLKDKEDERLEALFRAGPVADDGFSEHVMGRIRRRAWIRRWTLPAAVFLGGVVAAKPAAELLLAMVKVLSVMPGNLPALPLDSLPQVSAFITCGALAGLFALFLKALEE